jgi:hypothetical protein
MSIKSDIYDYTEQSLQGQNKHFSEGTAGMKKCPFCAEQIQAEAVKCRYCGEFLDGSKRGGSEHKPKKWYFATGTVVIALLCIGPIALPIVWFNPHYKPATKAIVTVIVLVVTILCMYLVTSAYRQLLEQFAELEM